MIKIDKTQGTGNTVNVAEVNEIMSPTMVQDVLKDTQLPSLKGKYEMEILKSGEVDKLTSEIDIHNLSTIIEFGKKPAEEMANVSDQVLQNYNSMLMTESSRLINNLLAILDKIDCGELQDIDKLLEKHRNNKKSFFDKFKESLEEKLNRAVAKYKGIGSELEAIVAELTSYEQKIKESNVDITRMYDAAINTFRNLTAYSLSAEQAVREIEEYRDKVQQEFNETASGESSIELQNVNNALMLMQKRSLALQGAEALALQSIPTFKVQEKTNANLAMSINETFIITIPAFKSALVNSVIAKQQSIMAQGLQAVNEVNSKVIRQNADNVGKQLLLSQQLMQNTAIKTEDLEYSMTTLLNAARQYKDREKQMIETSKVEQGRIKEIEERYLQALKNNETI